MSNCCGARRLVAWLAARSDIWTLRDPALLNAKLREEIEEVIEADTIDEVAWETADVIYHILVRAQAGGVTFDRICDELRSRIRT